MRIEFFSKTLKGHFYVLLGYQTSVKVHYATNQAKKIWVVLLNFEDTGSFFQNPERTLLCPVRLPT